MNKNERINLLNQIQENQKGIMNAIETMLEERKNTKKLVENSKIDEILKKIKKEKNITNTMFLVIQMLVNLLL